MSAPTTITADQVLAEARARHEHVGAYQLSETYESMQAQQDQAARKEHSAYYTPQAFVSFIARFALERGLAQVGPDPAQVLRIVACDPACGAGVFLVEAARLLATAYAERRTGAHAAPALVTAVMPLVIVECVFGVDIDPTAAELSRLALSLETGGALTPEMLERNVIRGNTLEGDSPPAMEERLGHDSTDQGAER